MILNILICFLILSILIIGHELGHFLVAKALNVRVEEFGIGYPPKIFSFKKGETTYSLNWIPFGGFNKFSGDTDGSDDRAINNQSPWKKILIQIAGSVATFLLTFVIVFIAIIVPYDSIVDGNIMIQDVVQDSPADAAGLEIGDIILKANGNEVSYSKPLSDAINEKLDQENILTIQKDNGEIIDITIIPRSNPPEGQGAFGITVQVTNYVTEKTNMPVSTAIKKFIPTTIEYYKLFFEAIGMIFEGEQKLEFTGPIGMIQMTSSVAEYGLQSLILFMALLCINLTVFNLLPIPGLDGGQILISLLEIIKGKPISLEKQSIITMIGFMLLLSIMLLATYQDIERLITGVSLLP